MKGEAGPPGPSLLIAPASLLANWADEIAKFAPGVKRSRGSPIRDAGGRAQERFPAASLTGTDLVITSYGSADTPALAERGSHGAS